MPLKIVFDAVFSVGVDKFFGRDNTLVFNYLS